MKVCTRCGGDCRFGSQFCAECSALITRIILRAKDGMSNREIGEHVGLTRNAVERRKNRALAKLRREKGQ